MKLVPLNGHVICKPYHTQAAEVEVKGGLAVIKKKQELIPLEIIGQSNEIPYAAKIAYVEGEQVNSIWHKKPYTIDGVIFVLVPIQVIKAVGIPDHVAKAEIGSVCISDLQKLDANE